MKHRFRYWMWRFFRKNFWDRTASTEAPTSMHNFSTGHWCQTSAISSEPTIMYCICPLRVKTNKKRLLHFRTWVFLLRVASGISTISTMATIIRCYNQCSHHLNHVSTMFPCFSPCFPMFFPSCSHVVSMFPHEFPMFFPMFSHQNLRFYTRHRRRSVHHPGSPQSPSRREAVDLDGDGATFSWKPLGNDGEKCSCWKINVYVRRCIKWDLIFNMEFNMGSIPPDWKLECRLVLQNF